MTEHSSLTSGVQQLLDDLRQGSNVAEPRHYLAAEGYQHLAHATLDNAVALCSTTNCDDFRIFSALYAVRHGLELWLKALIIDIEIDRVLDGVTAGKTFDELKDVALLERDDRRQVKRGLVRSLCQFRNLALGLTHPDFRQQEIEERFCSDGIARIRAKAKESRYNFANAWAIPISKHELMPLWERARPRFKDLTYRAKLENQVDLGAELLDEERLSSVCQLFDVSDHRGDAFRYPTSLVSGDLHRFQSISLEALGRLASQLDSTVNVYGTVIKDAYSHSTLGYPRPMLD